MKRPQKKILGAALAVFAAALLGGALYGHVWLGNAADTAEKAAAVRGGAQPAEDAAQERTLDEQIDALLEKMTLTEKIGQMVLVGVQGTQLDADSEYMLRQFHFGGVILFDRNLKGAAQTKQLVSDLQAFAQKSRDAGGGGEPVPLFIGIDEEGGTVTRGEAFLAPPESEQAIGETGDPQAAEKSAARVGADLRELGVNLNFAPVVDVGSQDTRSFSADAQDVVRFSSAAADGYEQAGIFYALKHFPGIGKGEIDSHAEVSSVTAPRETLEKEDLLPFRTLIAQRKPENYFVLVAHLIYPALDGERSASQSHAIMTDLLRGELGYEGIIVTDDMEMGAAANHASFRALGKNAVLAGADIVLICHEYAHEEEIYMGIKDAVDSGEIVESRIDDSVRRILRAKLTHELM